MGLENNKKDIIKVLILTTTLIGICLGLYFYNLKTENITKFSVSFYNYLLGK